MGKTYRRTKNVWEDGDTRERRSKKKAKKKTINTIISELKKNLNDSGVTAKNMKNKKKIMSETITNYFTNKKIDNKYKNKILTRLVESMLKG